ncbi:MAG: hypothetical protein F4Z00_12810 [Acidimicrobiaceae bacterium]|nr:hypothetical protein [Acidimicrobiaceae bacterium]MXZ66405.1 hypothetical protein [Acidimicrobiaceae bacterium]MYF34351.1 hypothetical protein [Acidimicrobiaceae bacterium]MYG78916.1 hypothetical protein [Acidimicrobiaceae bacterium]MYJ83524.1 hypothetical protein [Acidimicrobiaceae bacterium]
MRRSLLDKIESEALGGDVVKALRLCISLGGHSASAELREWATRELRGYGGDDELPDYRRIQAPLCVDTISPTGIAKGLSISTFQLPEFVREDITEELDLTHSVPELLGMVRTAEREGESVRLLPLGASEVLLYMNQSGEYRPHVERLYWQVAPTAISGVVERVCTDIVELVGEMRAGLPKGQDLPSPDVASQAVNVVVKGDGHRVVVKNVRQESGDGAPEESPRHRTLKVIAWVATIVAAIVSIVAFLYMQLSGEGTEAGGLLLPWLVAGGAGATRSR